MPILRNSFWTSANWTNFCETDWKKINFFSEKVNTLKMPYPLILKGKKSTQRLPNALQSVVSAFERNTTGRGNAAGAAPGEQHRQHHGHQRAGAGARRQLQGPAVATAHLQL
eukprot:EG_transcript_29920